MPSKLTRILSLAVVSTALGWTAPVAAGPILFNTFLQFSFFDVGVPALGCFPDDPMGDFCLPSAGTPTQFLDAPPWTFLSPHGATLTIADVFLAGDQFEIFDFGTSLGLTSVPVGTDDCGDDPLVCLADPNVSSGVFSLLAGNHSITIVPTATDGGGVGYLRVVPEPQTIALLGIGLLGLWGTRTRGRATGNL